MCDKRKDYTPFEGSELEVFYTVLQKALQVHLTNTSNGIDISTGAVILCEVSSQAAKTKNTFF